MKVLSVVGTRPNFVKLAALEPYLSRLFDHVIVHTGQHYDYELSKVFFQDLSIPEPHYYLGVGSGTHCYQVGEIIRRLEGVLLKERPNLVIVYGDTNSTLGGALAACKSGFRVAHVEAGLRSYDMSMPEEVNRRIIDHISWLLFAPTKTAFNNLVNESVQGKIHLVGDVHVDVLLKYVQVARRKSRILQELGLKPKEYMVVTVHRAENTDNEYRLRSIVEILKSIKETIIFPVHPRTRNSLKRYGLHQDLEKSENVVLINPLGYLDFINLLANSKLVITDSGGVQKEAYLLRVPAIVLRDRTEWVELVDLGWVKLADVDRNKVLKYISEYSSGIELGYDVSVLGDGSAGKKIADIILKELTSAHSRIY